MLAITCTSRTQRRANCSTTRCINVISFLIIAPNVVHKPIINQLLTIIYLKPDFPPSQILATPHTIYYEHAQYMPNASSLLSFHFKVLGTNPTLLSRPQNSLVALAWTLSGCPLRYAKHVWPTCLIPSCLWRLTHICQIGFEKCYSVMLPWPQPAGSKWHFQMKREELCRDGT